MIEWKKIKKENYESFEEEIYDRATLNAKPYFSGVLVTWDDDFDNQFNMDGIYGVQDYIDVFTWRVERMGTGDEE